MIHVGVDFPDVAELNVHDMVEIKGGRGSNLHYFNGTELEPMKLPKLKVRGLNTEHHAFQYLFNEHPEICILNITGDPGTGKTFCALGCALESILEYQTQNKIIIVRELVPASRWKAGYLPGSYDVKTRMAFDAIADAMYAIVKNTKLFKADPDLVIEELISKGLIEFTTLEFFRGRNLSDCIIIADDAQNLSVDNVRLLVTRMGQKSRLVLTGDRNQVDDNKLERLGVDYLDSVMKGSKYYTGLEFTHSECRSGVVKEFLDREKELGHNQ